ncbi:uncharacterized protein [Branchiostoma lanceolatum]|uniref:uncharacterized protein n=1 Tax=Branchiostoma lanceolatum TaxID=7740 RepID=UPI0034549DF1
MKVWQSVFLLLLICALVLESDAFWKRRRRRRRSAGCSAPPNPANTARADCSSPYTHGEKCSYRCHTGYTQVSGNTVKTCSNGQWTGIELVCKKVIQVPDDQMEGLVSKYAPKVWLANGEGYKPSSVGFHLQNVKVHDGGNIYSSTPSTLPTCSDNCYLSSNKGLSKPSSTLPFFGGEPVGSTEQPPVYAVWKRINGVTTDIFYWMFYPYNRGKKVCIGFRAFGKCIGGYSNFGHHVGDWEHMTARLVGDQPNSIYVSAHNFGGTIFLLTSQYCL